MIRTVPKTIRLAHVHEAAVRQETQAQGTEAIDPTLDMDRLLASTVGEETLFVPETVVATPGFTPGGRRRSAKAAPPSAPPSARPRATRKRNYGFDDTDAEGSGTEQ